MSDSVKLTYNDETFEFPLIEGTEDEKGMDQKVIAIPNEKIDMNSKLLNDISDLSQIQLNVIHNFFSNYKANEKDK